VSRLVLSLIAAYAASPAYEIMPNTNPNPKRPYQLRPISLGYGEDGIGSLTAPDPTYSQSTAQSSDDDDSYMTLL
jgi:hypothetical protein